MLFVYLWTMIRLLCDTFLAVGFTGTKMWFFFWNGERLKGWNGERLKGWKVEKLKVNLFCFFSRLILILSIDLKNNYHFLLFSLVLALVHDNVDLDIGLSDKHGNFGSSLIFQITLRHPDRTHIETFPYLSRKEGSGSSTSSQSNQPKRDGIRGLLSSITTKERNVVAEGGRYDNLIAW